MILDMVSTDTSALRSSSNPSRHLIPITIASGDGVGPEIMAAVRQILDAADAPLAYEEIEIGERVYRSGVSSGIRPEAWDSLRRTKVFLKAPITTPQGGGFKSLNVTIRKTMGLYANVRPVRTYAPYVETIHPTMDVVVVRENEEDLYAGIEHRQTDEVFQCLKLITRPGCERIVRYAFEYAVANGRKKITCMTKDNIMKLTDGLFHRVFEEIGTEYPQIQQEHMIIDIGMARVAKYPERFDVIVTPNLYGDILSDVVAEVAGTVGLAPSANIGDQVAMFEAIHGSAPDIAGKGIANPSGLLLSAVMMLVHVGEAECASRIHNAWLAAIEAGAATADLGGSHSTEQFAKAVIDHLGDNPQHLPAVTYSASAQKKAPTLRILRMAEKTMIGIDVFAHHWGQVDSLAERLTAVAGEEFELQMITNRGVKVWPAGMPETFCTDHWRCRFMSRNERPVTHAQLVALLGRIADNGVDFIKSENLCLFDGAPGFSLGQGQ